MTQNNANHDAVPAATARTDAESDRTDKAAPRPGKGAGNTPVTQHTPGKCSSPRGCTSEPVAWAVVFDSKEEIDCEFIYPDEATAGDVALDSNGGVVPLYRHPQPMLTDAEREAVRFCAVVLDMGERPDCAATLRGLLERLGGGTPVRDNCPPRNNPEMEYPASRPPQKFYGMNGDTQDQRPQTQGANEPSGASGGYPCPNGCGIMRPSGKAADGYPISQCDFCNSFSLAPAPGREPPLRRVLRALHDAGHEPGQK